VNINLTALFVTKPGGLSPRLTLQIRVRTFFLLIPRRSLEMPFITLKLTSILNAWPNEHACHVYGCSCDDRNKNIRLHFHQLLWRL